jgi:hypothetical protein
MLLILHLVFLRLLEYFEGIMFLTTNRIRNFDAALKSRVHLAIKYPGLSPESQGQLWTTFLTNNSQRPVPHWLTDTLLQSWAAYALNGRQIRNAVRTAMAIAVSGGREIRQNDIDMSIQAMKDFDRDFKEAMQGTDKETGLDNDHDAEGSQRLVITSGSAKRRRLV